MTLSHRLPRPCILLCRGARDRVRQGAVPICLPAALLHRNDGQLVARKQAISHDRHLKRLLPIPVKSRKHCKLWKCKKRTSEKQKTQQVGVRGCVLVFAFVLWSLMVYLQRCLCFSVLLVLCCFAFFPGTKNKRNNTTKNEPEGRARLFLSIVVFGWLPGCRVHGSCFYLLVIYHFEISQRLHVSFS